jgi:hypothetical protein
VTTPTPIEIKQILETEVDAVAQIAQAAADAVKAELAAMAAEEK